MRAVEYLEQIKKIDVIILNKRKERQRWASIADGLGGFSVSDRVQTSRNLHRGSDAIGEYIDIDREIEELEAKRQGIIDTIQRLPYNEYRVLYMLYVEEHMLKELPSEFNKSYAWVKDKKRKALKHVQNILDEKKG